MNFINLARAEQLLQQGRFDLAETELRKYLAANFDDSEAHAYLALCLINLRKNKEAAEEVKTSIGLSPDFPFAHYLQSKLYIDEDEYKKADEAIREALRLDPSEAEYYETLSIIYFNQGKYKQALEEAERGLEMNPEHIGCLNIRARSLVKLDRKEYANESFAASFNKDPDNSYTHANQGWAYLEQRNYKGALEHFRESLRLDPRNEFAKSGLVEALKAKYLVYKWFLQFMFWANSLSPGVRWGLLIGVVVVNNQIPLLSPVYIGFVLFTWFLDVIFNTLLRLNKYGKHALNQDQLLASNYFIGFIALGTSALICNLWVKDTGLHVTAIVSFGMLFPVVGTLRQQNKKNRRKSLIFTFALAAVGLALIITALLNLTKVQELLMPCFFIGVVAYTWFINIIK